MISLIKDNYEALRRLCVDYRVKRLDVFGSALTEHDFDPEKSDLDFLVDFLPLKQGQYAETYFGLLEGIERLFGRHVDLVMTGAIKNPYFLQSVNNNHQVLYAA